MARTVPKSQWDLAEALFVEFKLHGKYTGKLTCQCNHTAYLKCHHNGDALKPCDRRGVFVLKCPSPRGTEHIKGAALYCRKCAQAHTRPEAQYTFGEHKGKRYAEFYTASELLEKPTKET